MECPSSSLARGGSWGSSRVAGPVACLCGFRHLGNSINSQVINRMHILIMFQVLRI